MGIQPLLDHLADKAEPDQLVVNQELSLRPSTGAGAAERRHRSRDIRQSEVTHGQNPDCGNNFPPEPETRKLATHDLQVWSEA